MTNPLNSYQTNFGRFYSHPSVTPAAHKLSAVGSLARDLPGFGAVDPKDPYGPKPSITNITGMIDKKFLPPYYAKLVAEHAIPNLESLIAKREQFGNDIAIGVLKAVVNQPNPAALIGDEVHAAIDAWIKGEPATPLTTPTARNMFAQFENFMSIVKPKILHSEYTVWSYAHGFAGTGDLMWLIDRSVVSPQGVNIPEGVWIVDTKSGNNVYPEVALQTTAAAHADVILDGDGNESPMPSSDVQGVLHVRPRSVKLHKLERTDEAWETFLAAKRIFDWKRFDADLVLQEPYKTELAKAA